MGWMLDRIGQCRVELAGQAEHVRKQLVDIELELADLIAAERVVGRILAEPGAGSSGFHVADELVFQFVPGSVRGSPNRGITLAPKPVTEPMRSSAIVTTSSPWARKTPVRGSAKYIPNAGWPLARVGTAR